MADRGRFRAPPSPLAHFVNVVYLLHVLHESPATPKDRRHRANLARILDAASTVVFEEGVDALSIKRVAERADYTGGAIYRYFPSKDALLAAVVARAIDDLGVRLEAASHTTAGPLARVVAQTRAYRDFAREAPHAFVLVATMVNDPRRRVTDAESVNGVLVRTVRAMHCVVVALNECVASGELEPADVNVRALTLFVGLQGALQLRKLEGRAPAWVQADAVFDATLHALLRGFGARTETLRDVLALGR